jgi:hypothetical protein
LTISNNGVSDLTFDIHINQYALQFDGVDDGVVIPDHPSLDITNEITIEAWVYPVSYQEWERILAKHWTSEEEPWVIYTLQLTDEYNGLEEVLFHITIGGVECVLVSSAGLPLNTLTHIAGTYDGTTMAIYINGVLNGSISQTGNIDTNNQPVYIGKDEWNNWNTFNGTIDEVRLWNIARTQAEIQAGMYHELTGNEPGLAGYWRFNEGSGNIAFDQTSNGNNGTLLNGAAWTASPAPIFPGWLSITPTTGTIPAGSSEDISVTFDATGLSDGDYNADIIISNNDPNNPEITIPAYLYVTAGSGINDPYAGLIPKEYVLFQNFPNPFNPITHIRFGLPKAGDVKIELFNILGKCVATLINERKPAGYHVIHINASEFASGLYFYQIKVGDFHKVRKMLFLK